MQLKKLKEQWTSTSIIASFRMPSLSGLSGQNIILNLPLLNLGWTFSVTLTQQMVRPRTGLSSGKILQWLPTSLSFQAQNSSIPWKDTSMTAELRFGCDGDCDMCNARFPEPCSSPCPRCSRTNHGLKSLGPLTINLANNHSANVPLKSDSLSLGSLWKVGLAVTISECPFVGGLFQVSSDYLHPAEDPPQTKGRSNDDILCQSLTTGRIFDVTFLTFPTRRTLGLVDQPIPTYAPLSVVDQQINMSSAKLQEEWRSAFSVADGHSNMDGKSVCEIVCPAEYDYDLDSDYGDEDATSPIPPSPPSEQGDGASSEAEHSGDETRRSCSSVIVIESAEATNEVSIDHNPTDIIKASKVPLPTVAAPETERTILIKFAAHRTWHTFLWYCYTGSVKFGNLKSQIEPGVPRQRSELLQDEPACSPKSMYRLADLLGNNVLKVKALDAIKERLTGTNVIEEAFSEFTSKYPEVQDVQLRALLKHCQSADVKKSFLKMISKFHTMPHAEPMLSAFYDKLTKSCQ